MSYQSFDTALTYEFEIVLGGGLLLLAVLFMMFCCCKMAERKTAVSVVFSSFSEVFSLEPVMDSALSFVEFNTGTDTGASMELELFIPILDNKVVINLDGISIYKLHKKNAVYVSDLPCELPPGVEVRQLRKRDAVYLRDLRAVAILVGV